MIAGLGLAVLCLQGATIAGPVSVGLRSWGISLGVLACLAFLFALVRGPTLLAGGILDAHRGLDVRGRNWGRELLWDVLAFGATTAASYFTIQFLFVLAITLFTGAEPARMTLLALNFLCAGGGWILLPRISKWQDCWNTRTSDPEELGDKG
ncbi:hypothetical protein [Haloferula sp. A504]|uniref:hypothetical protein n=1 Tax=Haloferula sp. A504 TaxID=3373601 RepID=UPI0031C3C2A8|nr:hypothetical protein [Verrucomicrobiaceae bacterium E54]